MALPESFPPVDETLPCQFAHGGRFEFGEHGKEDGFFQRDAQVAEVAHAAFHADGVRVILWVVCQLSVSGVRRGVVVRVGRSGPRYLSKRLFKLVSICEGGVLALLDW